MLLVQGVRGPPGLRGSPAAKHLPGTEGIDNSRCARMIPGVDLTPVDVLSWPFRNSPSEGTSQATGTAAVASLGEVTELMGYS